MTARSRVLTSTSDTTPTNSPPPPKLRIIIAVLICALFCFLGLVVLVCRCSCFQRYSSTSANKGLNKKVLKSLPKLTYNESDEHATKLSECAICVTEFVNGEEIRLLPECGHGFHVQCIDAWLESHSSCPSCRKILVETSEVKK